MERPKSLDEQVQEIQAKQALLNQVLNTPEEKLEGMTKALLARRRRIVSARVQAEQQLRALEQEASQVREALLKSQGALENIDAMIVEENWGKADIRPQTPDISKEPVKGGKEEDETPKRKLSTDHRPDKPHQEKRLEA